MPPLAIKAPFADVQTEGENNDVICVYFFHISEPHGFGNVNESFAAVRSRTTPMLNAHDARAPFHTVRSLLAARTARQASEPTRITSTTLDLQKNIVPLAKHVFLQ